MTAKETSYIEVDQPLEGKERKKERTSNLEGDQHIRKQ